MSSGRYQSRFFNLVHLHSRQVKESWERTLRRLQVATQWSVEVLLYPVYLLLQSADAVAKTLSSQKPVSQPQLSPHHSDFPSPTPPAADTAIQHVLEAVQHLPSEETTITPVTTPKLWRYFESLWSKVISQPITVPNPTASSISPSSQNELLKRQLSLVRGIATNLGDRQLVLVSIENEILDILTPQQQAKLSASLVSAVANYLPDLYLPEKSSPGNILSRIERGLSKLIGGKTVKLPLLNQGINQDYKDKIITSLDTAIAQIENKTFVPSQEIIRITQTHIRIFIYGKEQLVARGDIAVANDDLETQEINISALIEAAINYFFGVGKSKNLNARGAKGKLLNQHNSNGNQEQWLNWGDLYGDTPTLAGENTTPLLRINPAIAVYPSAGLSWNKKLPLPPTKSESSLVPRKKTPRHLVRIQKTSGRITTIKSTETSTPPLPGNDESTTEGQDWIETKATPVGYEKHFLERVLELLDHAMLWLEERLVKIFHSLQSLWRGK